MEKIKILYIIDVFDVMGGTEKILYEIVQHIDKKRFIPHIVCFEGGKLSLMTEKIGIWTKTLRLKNIYGIYSIIKGIELFKFIKRERFQIVVTYHESSDFWGGLIAKAAGVPVIISNRRDMGYKLKRRHIWLYRIMNPLFDQIIAVSEAVKEAIADREWANRNKIITISNGIDSSKYAPEIDGKSLKAELGLDQEKKIVGMVANFREIKGQMYFVEAIKEIRKEFLDVQFVIVGYKNTDYFPKVKKLIEDLKLTDCIFCTGPRDDIPELLQIFDISVLSSLNEGFSNTILESMASGKAVIAARSGGNPEAVKDGETGFLFTPCDSKELSEAILKLLKNERLRIEMGNKGRAKVTKDFTLDRMITKTEAIYEHLLYLKKMYFTLAHEGFSVKYHIKKYLKVIACYFLYYSGIIPAYVKVSKRPPQILAYHSIGDGQKYFGMTLGPGVFEKQMEYLHKHYNLLSLADYCKSVEDDRAIPDNCIVITFDDGYMDNYTNAFPILKKYNIPATIFVSTDPVAKGEPLFFDAIVYGIYNTGRKYLNLEEYGFPRYLINNSFLKFKTTGEFNMLSQKMNSKERNLLIRRVLDSLDLNYENIRGAHIYLSWKEIMEMRQHGIEIGAHTKSHLCLPFLAEEEMKSEIFDCKDILEEKLGEPVKSFAYPYGGIQDFNENVKNTIQEAGLKCACTLYEKGTEGGIDLFALGRKVVTNSISTGFSENFSKPLFATEVCGFFDRYFRGNNSL